MNLGITKDEAFFLECCIKYYISKSSVNVETFFDIDLKSIMNQLEIIEMIGEEE